MITKLPEKLLVLRKHYGYSQQEIADKMGVNVVEYMGWENGRAICTLSQFKRLAGIFSLSLEEMLRNTADLNLPTYFDDSIQIPFVKQEEDLVFFAGKGEVEVETPPVEEAPKVKVVEEAPKPKVEKTNKKINLTKKQMQIAGAAGILVLIFIIGAAFLLSPKKGGTENPLNLSLNDQQRLAAGKQFSVMMDDHLNPQQYGIGLNLSEFQGVVSVSARTDFVLGLKSDGTVVGSGSNSQGQLNVGDWKQITGISAGNSHSVGVKEDGTVVCAGSNRSQECEVSGWKDVKTVVAGDGFTLGIHEDGTLDVAGTIQNSGLLKKQTNVVSAAIGTKEIALLKEDQTVEVISYTGTIASDCSSWENIIQVAAGSNYIAGLDTKGEVHIVTKDAQLQKEVESWSNIKAIEGSDLFLIGYNGSEMVGAGNRSYQQFPENKKEEALAKVTNVKVSQVGEKIEITWDKVDGAQHYIVTINTPSPYSSNKITNNQVMVDQSRFENGETYQITIIAGHPTDETLNSDAFTVDYKHSLTPTPVPVFTLTIKYVDKDGKEVFPDHVEEIAEGGSYRVVSPKKEGYRVTPEIVEGVMDAVNLVERVVYTIKPTPTPTPTPTPEATATPDETACLVSGGKWIQEGSLCACPEGFELSDSKTCVKTGQ